ncbi:MAG TPA: hypothetical protein VFT55_01320, partial [Planctomycetota bacterium]|nr:hypothetical protein [Planctomycetota bacterium]
ERLHNAGLRGVEFDVDCSVHDVNEFAMMLNRCRSRTRDHLLSQWQKDHARLRPLPLVFTGHYAEGADGAHDAPAATDANPPEPAPAAPAPREPKRRERPSRPRLSAILQRLAEDDSIRQQLKTIESQTEDPTAAIDRGIDLLEAIGELLPADIANDPAQIEGVVRKVLDRVEDGLGAVVQRKAKVKGGELLRMALGVARQYFPAQAPKQAMSREELPTGRPEDEGIVADLDLLLHEMAVLPEAANLRLPPATDFEPGSSTMSRELCGVLLHTLSHSTNEAVLQAASARLASSVRVLGTLGAKMVDQYLNPKDQGTSIAQPARTRILRALVDGGLEQLVRAHGFVDAAFVARGFPEAMPLAARVLGQDADGLRTMREGLELLGTMLPLGGVTAAAKAGVLLDPVVVKALVAIGGDLVLPFLPHAASHGSREIRVILLDLARTLTLPEPETAALRSVASVDDLPRAYLQNLLAAAAQKKFDETQRAATGRLLRAAVERSHERGDHDAYLTAIDNLRHVPEPETRALLRFLATAGRFTQFGSQARAIRRCARGVLRQIASMPS